ncbi:glycosyltransferase involved in cell wall biosynthesis [Arcticibacter tournemirensis]|uniref:Glycosyltransferase family 4 protein n=1 Tax=Arcticibacter tournemirensis TaxID=699437 RepID=A0A4Q0M9N4_9SPHI|nr:glycosyltransferase family 4 protein [Arcticibacter tournemirensis]KAA8486759.1 glycosyltransferase family 4 protein [Arcticibacter tournemirensis]RXF69466.1 glycosyltransferase family 4 protein [Arcticibacter tournemirensis]TQM49301.1 glycosyltransferase involved in cell wall biosynthesis [Arcticibacter tournemirensis]
MRIAVLAPVAWRTPPRHYGPWEQIASNLTEGLVSSGFDVTLFATGDSLTTAKLDFVAQRGYEEDKEQDAKVLECLHISNLMEKASRFDIIHNHFDFLPLTWSRLIAPPMITTIHGFSSHKIVPVFKKYNKTSHYISISNADRSRELDYLATVYNGINTAEFTFNNTPEDYLLYFGRIHHDKGTAEAIQIAMSTKRRLIIAGIIQDSNYYETHVKPYLGDQIQFIGSAGPEERNILMGNASALLHPINFKEPFGMSVAEAMLCGTPVIAFNKGSMPELIKHEETGFLANSPEEAIEAVHEIPKINRSACHKWAASRFSKEKMVSDYIKAYQKVLEN